MSILATEVIFPPNGATPPHSHAGAFISAYILSGHILNAMNNGPLHILGPGDKFKENPSCKHRVCSNVSGTEGARILSTLILETEVLDRIGVEGTVVIDEEYREMVIEAQAKKQKDKAEEETGGDEKAA
jgi:hypothetical protein